MKVFICDDAPRRPWSSLLPESRPIRFVAPTRPFRPGAFVDRATGGEVGGPGLVIVHPEPGRERLDAMCVAARARGGLSIVTISGGDRQGCKQPDDARAYRRQQAVGEEDEYFVECVRRFVAADTSDPPFALLEPSSWDGDLALLYLVSRGEELGASGVRETFLTSRESGWENRVRLSWIGRGGRPEEWEQLLCADKGATTLSRVFPAQDFVSGVGWVVKAFASEHARTRGKLRHSWLENEVLGRRAEFIARLSTRSSKGRVEFDERLAEGSGEFSRCVELTRALAESAREALSPCRLLVGAGLERAAHDALCEVLEREFLDRTQLVAQTLELKMCASNFAEALAAFRLLWLSGDGHGVGASFEGLQEAGRALHACLGGLPAGVVLP